jgi:cyclase
MGLEQMRGFAYADTPDIPVTGDTTFVIGTRRIVVMHPGAAHTAGDLMIWLPDERVLFAGDVLVEDGISMVVDGSSGAMLGALDSINALRPRAVVPGHGRLPAHPVRLVEATRCYFLRVRAAMREAVENGVRMGQALAQLPPADRDRPVSRASRVRRNAVRVYSEMERTVMDGSETPAARRAEAARLAACPAG